MWSDMTLYDDNRKTTLKIKNFRPATDTQLHGHAFNFNLSVWLYRQPSASVLTVWAYKRPSSHEHILCRRREMCKIYSQNGWLCKKLTVLGSHGSDSLCRDERENKMAATYNVLAFKRWYFAWCWILYVFRHLDLLSDVAPSYSSKEIARNCY